MTLSHRYRTLSGTARCESAPFCQVATQVSLYVLRLLSRVPFSLNSGPRVSSSVTPMFLSEGAPRTPMHRSTPSFAFIVGRRKLSTRRWWSERNAPAGGFSTRAVFWPDRTPRSRPASARKIVTGPAVPTKKPINPARTFRISARQQSLNPRCSFNPARLP